MEYADTVISFLNPLGLPLWAYAVAAVAKFIAEEVLNVIILTFLKLISHVKLPSREPKPIGKGLEFLQTKDYIYLTINQGVELVFLFHLAHLGLSLPIHPEQLTVSNTLVAFYATVFLNDFFYYFLHRFLHVPAIYPYIHKHHHRQALPVRGYVDAANEHPLEQVGGQLCVYGAIKVLIPLVGFHALTMFVFFAVFAVLAYLNHTAYDVKLGLMGINYTVRAHETHHRMLRGNYSQNTMFWDKLFGTFIEYPTRKSEE